MDSTSLKRLLNSSDDYEYGPCVPINARTELALRYNDISPLENHHCSIAFRILEMDESNIFKHMSIEDFKYIREGIIRCVLATDMARHNEILAQFKDAVFVGFDFSNKSHVNLLCMVLIKVADISNEARPLEVAEPWLDRLLQEFFTQSDAEKIEGLPVTPFMDKDKITKPSSQCSFIGFVILPLFEALGDLLDELVPMIVEPARAALEHYRRLNEAHHKNSVADTLSAVGSVGNGSPSGGTASPPSKNMSKSTSGYSVRKTSISFSPHPDEDDEDMISDLSTDDEETVTEVAISEKTLKFKISTESSSDRKSHPGSRKGSRDRHQDDEEGLLVCESCHRRDPSARSNSLAEPEWRFGAPVTEASHKRRSSSTVATSVERRKSGGGLGPTGAKANKKEEPRSPSTGTVSSVCPSPKKSSSLSPSLVSRLKRLGWRSTGDERNVPPGSPASLKDQISSEESRLSERRVSTLPKVNRKRFASEARKGWRGLLGRRDEASTSKRNGLSSDSIGESEESLPVNNNKSKKNKKHGGGESSPSDRSPSATHQPTRWAMSSLVSSFRSKKSKSLHEPPR